MTDRERSRSRSPARDESKGGDDNHAQENGDSGAEEVKLYVGNLDYGKRLLDNLTRFNFYW